jgi:dCTP diphosphatase
MKSAKEAIIKFRDARDWKQFHTPENLAKSISIEAGELLECFQWNSNYNRDEVIEELADVVNYCILLGDALGVELENIVLEKLKKTEKKYPVERVKGVSTKYNKLDD